MYVGRDFDVADPGESAVFGFDYTNDLAAGDVIISASASLTVLTGVDPSPSSRLTGGTVVEGAGTQVVNRVVGLLAGVTYIFQIVATTQAGDVLSLYSHIPARAVY